MCVCAVREGGRAGLSERGKEKGKGKVLIFEGRKEERE